MPFKQAKKDAVENQETEDIHNPLYVQCLTLRGQNSGYFDLKGVELEEQGELADISILIDSGDPTDEEAVNVPPVDKELF